VRRRMLIIETFARGCEPRYRPAATPLVIRFLPSFSEPNCHHDAALQWVSLACIPVKAFWRALDQAVFAESG
jgi:hypothetical protein